MPVAASRPASGERACVDSGMSQRQVAKLLGVDEGTVRNDLRKDYAKNAQELRTDPDETPEDDAYFPFAFSPISTSRRMASERSIFRP